MKIMRVTYIALATLFSVASCSKEATEPGVADLYGGEIYFKTSLSDVASSRAQDMTLDRLESFQVTCFNTADRYKDEEGFLSPYFENATFVRRTNSAVGTYESSPSEGPRDWPANDGLMRFYAFSPSLSALAECNQALEDTSDNSLRLINSSTETESSVSIGYRLGNVHISSDISKQIDLVTAEATGKRLDFLGGVDLSFGHRLCQIELRAWGAGSEYDFEIAGVRLGNATVEGTYVFADDSDAATDHGWETGGNAVRDKVEYVYTGSAEEDTPAAGDRIFRINNKEHNTAESAGSIMGKGGCAMVIPGANSRWEALEDPNIGNPSYTTDRMYFSILMRVTSQAKGATIYPYPGNPYGMKVISYAVDPEGNILRRLYAGNDGEYYTDPELTQPYEATEGEEAEDFGWAAIPVDADWTEGNRYVYTLNYSEGIGLHDPEDPQPGKPIGGKPSIESQFEVVVEDWVAAEGHDTNLDVPKK